MSGKGAKLARLPAKPWTLVPQKHGVPQSVNTSNSSLVCLEMHFVGDGDCIENDLLALSYHYLLKNVILIVFANS